MSDTPRTDEAECFIDSDRGIVDSGLGRQLERELNAANQHIKRLEEAGDELAKWADRNTPATILNDWTQAKDQP